MSSDIKGVQSYIETKAAYTHCRNLAIAKVCQNASIKRFKTSLTEACSSLDTLPKRQQ